MQEAFGSAAGPCDNEFVGGLGVPSRERLRGLVAGILAAKSAVPLFADDDTLAEIGIASIDMVTLLLSVESTFNVEVPQHEITADVFRSIATIDALIQRLLGDGVTGHALAEQHAS